MAQPQKTIVGATAASGAAVVVTRGPLTDKFLMRVARHELTSDELVQLGVFLGMTRSAVQEIFSGSVGTVTSTFAVLESWRNNTKAVSPGDMYEILCGAYMELKKTDVTGKMKGQKRNILMFVDNCGAHPDVKLSNIKLVFLPPNTTSRLQPCDALRC
ncbi:hypothetical protein LSAT2_013946 [Lamellibrachia satsuma]|nr:hypothetical protein LSAT2_013946 [Lamellibrachia satsuma]